MFTREKIRILTPNNLLKKKSSNSDENFECYIENGKKHFFFKLSNFHIAVLVPQIYGKWLKKCISGRIWVK